MLEGQDLVKAFQGRGVLDRVSVTLESGMITALVGPNGCGKSTLMHILALLEEADAGTIRFRGVPVSQRDQLRGRITLVEQAPLMFSGTVRSNLDYAARLARRSGARPDVRSAIDLFEAQRILDLNARTLSGGELQLAALTRAVSIGPDVLLLDEPTSAADTASVQKIFAALRELAGRGVAILFSTHQVNDAYRWADEVLGMSNGRVDGVTPENVYRCDRRGVHHSDSTVSYTIGEVEVHAVQDVSPPATVLISPSDILVSTQPFASSARNHFRGKIIGISERGESTVSLTVDVGVQMTAAITRQSYREMGLAVGTPVYLTAKATAVRVF